MTARRVLRLARLAAHLAWGLLQALLVVPVIGRLPARTGGPLRLYLAQRWLARLLAVLKVRVTVTGEVSPRPVLMVANHVSWLDVAVLGATLPATFVAKAEVGRWPLLGWLAHRGGTLFLSRGVRASSRALADAMTFRLRRGESVALFPEATTTCGERVGHFHARLYQAALAPTCRSSRWR